jgi:hypothetical protein
MKPMTANAIDLVRIQPQVDGRQAAKADCAVRKTG